MPATNLNQYYSSQGKNLPGLTERGQQFEKLGLGKAADYKGTVEQNSTLLGKLSGGGSAPISAASPTIVAPKATAQPVIQNTNSPQPTISSPQSNLPDNSLASVLVARGGYNPVDAANAAIGPRAAELAKEFGVSDGSHANDSVGSSNSRLQSLNDQLKQRQDALNKAISGANDNPWYSQAALEGQTKKIRDTAKGEMDSLVTQINSEQRYQSQLAAQQRADEQTKRASEKTIQSTDNQGNVIVTKYNSDTGEVISQSSLGAIGKASKTAKGKAGGGKVSTTPKKAEVVSTVGQGAALGKTYPDLLAFGSKYGLAPTEVYKIYTGTNYYGRAPDNVNPKTGLPNN